MKNTVLSVIRHLFTFGGGFLAAKLDITTGSVESIAAAVVALVGAIWGAYDEHKAENAPKV